MVFFDCKHVSEWAGGDRHNFGYYISAKISDQEITNHSPHALIMPQTITVFATIAEVIENSHQALIKKAWNKLTPQERMAVGLTVEPK